MRDVDGGQLGTPEPAGEADQQERPVARTRQRRRQNVKHLLHGGREQGRFARLCGPERPADAFERLAHDGVLHGGGRGVARGGVRLPDRGQFAAQRGGFVIGGKRSQIEGHGFGRRRQAGKTPSRAPAGKMAPVGGVGPAGVGGFGGGDERADLIREGGNLRQRGCGGREHAETAPDNPPLRDSARPVST